MMQNLHTAKCTNVKYIIKQALRNAYMVRNIFIILKNVHIEFTFLGQFWILKYACKHLVTTSRNNVGMQNNSYTLF